MKQHQAKKKTLITVMADEKLLFFRHLILINDFSESGFDPTRLTAAVDQSCLLLTCLK